MNNKINKSLIAVYLSLISLLIIFGRSLTGIYILNFRLGEWIIAGSFLLSIFFLFTPNSSLKKYLNLNELFVIYKLCFLSFFVLIVLNLPLNSSSYIFKSSSYVWSTIFLFVGYYFFSKINYESKFVYSFLLYLPLIYLLQTTYYPKFLSEFILKNSDKFEYLKAGDVLLIYVISTLVLQKLYSNNFLFFTLFMLMSFVFFPYFLYASKGAFLASIIYFVLQFLSFRKILLNLNLKVFFVLVASIIFFFLSSFYIYGNFVFEKTYESDSVQFVTDEVLGGLVAIVDERNTTEAFASLFIKDGRLYSEDVTANWRLQIWQDIFDDLQIKNKILFGYGYNEIIPAMDDKERRGSDGTNENVHNYLINIFARGGLFQLTLFLILHVSIIRLYHQKFGNYSILKLLIPVFIVSFFDTSMESVRFPFLYYSFLGYFLNEDSIYLY